MEKCVICEERIRPSDEAAEMYDPQQYQEPEGYQANVLGGVAGLVHGQCGLDRGWEMA